MVVEFKKAEALDFDGLFPKVDAKEYALLSGKVININAKIYESVQKNGYLVIGKHQIPVAALNIKTEAGKSEHQQFIQAKIAENFVFADPMVDVLMSAVDTKKNAILWGRGGHGKSEITEEVFKHLYDMGVIDEEPFVFAFGDGLTEDKLFGGMDVKLYKEEGIIKYMPEYSFMNHKYVIFEEIFDAPPNILMALKDIMTSKRFRQGHDTFNVKTELYIGLTNRSKTDFAEKDDSLKALVERFPLTYKAEWGSYSKIRFLDLFKCRFGKEVYEKEAKKLIHLADIIAYNNAQGETFISPRTAVHAAELYMKDKSLEYISELDEKTVNEFKKQQREQNYGPLQATLMKEVAEYIDEHNLEIEGAEENSLYEAVQEIEGDLGTSDLDLSDVLGAPVDSNIIEQKLNRAMYLVDLMSMTNFIDTHKSKSEDLYKRVKRIKANLEKELKS